MGKLSIAGEAQYIDQVEPALHEYIIEDKEGNAEAEDKYLSGTDEVAIAKSRFKEQGETSYRVDVYSILNRMYNSGVRFKAISSARLVILLILTPYSKYSIQLW